MTANAAQGLDREFVPHLCIKRGALIASCPLAKATTTVGGGPDCDIILPGIPEAVLFTLHRVHGRQGFSLEPHVAALIRNAERLPVATEVPLAHDDVVEFCEIAFSLSRMAPSEEGDRRTVWSLSRRSRSFAATCLLTTAVVLAVAAYPRVWDYIPSFWEKIYAASPVANGSLRDSIESVRSDIESTLAELNQTLKLAGISVDVKASASANSVIIDDTALSDSARARLADIAKAIQKRNEGLIILLSSAGNSNLARRIAAISLAPERIVFAQDGGRYREGDTFPDGWRIVSISPAGIKAARGRDTDFFTIEPSK